MAFADDFYTVTGYAGCTQEEIEYEKQRSRIDPKDARKGMKPEAIACYRAMAEEIRKQTAQAA